MTENSRPQYREHMFELRVAIVLRTFSKIEYQTPLKRLILRAMHSLVEFGALT